MVSAKPQWEERIRELVGLVEGRFSQYSSTTECPRKEQLQTLFWQCLELKQTLVRQRDIYEFVCSHPDTPLSTETMKDVTGSADPESKIKFSLWPSLRKIASTNETLLLEAESVWTKD